MRVRVIGMAAGQVVLDLLSLLTDEEAATLQRRNMVEHSYTESSVKNVGAIRKHHHIGSLDLMRYGWARSERSKVEPSSSLCTHA